MRKRISTLLILNLLFFSFAAELSHHHFRRHVGTPSVAEDCVPDNKDNRGQADIPLCVACLYASTYFMAVNGFFSPKTIDVLGTLTSQIQLPAKSLDYASLCSRAPPSAS
jgi:hypothetical protein